MKISKQLNNIENGINWIKKYWGYHVYLKESGLERLSERVLIGYKVYNNNLFCIIETINGEYRRRELIDEDKNCIFMPDCKPFTYVTFIKYDEFRKLNP